MAQSCSLLPDHLMPMMQIEDRSQPGEIVSQVFNFVDVMGGLNNLNLEGKSISQFNLLFELDITLFYLDTFVVLEKFLISRGIIKP